MSEPPPLSPSPPAGLLESFRTLAGGLIDSVRDRVELLSLELQEEKMRLAQMFILASLAIFSGIMMMTFATLVVVHLFWESARLAVLLGFAFVYAGATVVLAWAFRRCLRRQTRPLAGTLEELETDLRCIRPQN